MGSGIPIAAKRPVGGQEGVGENIMLQFHSIGQHQVLNWKLIEALQKSWMYSEGHSANLLNRHYTQVGHGIIFLSYSELGI